MQQAITWANVDPDLCRHIVSLGHNELIYKCLYCIFYHIFWAISAVMILNIFLLHSSIITKSAIWFINQCLGLGHETMAYAVCFTMLWLLYRLIYLSWIPFFFEEYAIKCVSIEQHPFVNNMFGT